MWLLLRATILVVSLWISENLDALPAMTWERRVFFDCLLSASVIVAIGVALEGPEIIHAVRKAFGGLKTEPPTWMALIGLIGWGLVAFGVAGEGAFEAIVSHEDTRIEQFNDTRVANAITDSGDAKASAVAAAGAANSAVDSAAATKREAEAFRPAIETAVNLANEAESHLKDALAQAEAATKLAQGYSAEIEEAKRAAIESKSLVADIRQLSEEAQKQVSGVAETLARINSTRSLIDKEVLVYKLSKFAGTEYGFEAVNGDNDSTNILAEVERVLVKAKWRRVDQPSGLVGINITVDGEQLTVAVLPRSGISISIQSNLPFGMLERLETRNSKFVPMNVSAAIDLNLGLAWHILPHEVESSPYRVDVKSGDSTVVLISVGSKRP